MWVSCAWSRGRERSTALPFAIDDEIFLECVYAVTKGYPYITCGVINNAVQLNCGVYYFKNNSVCILQANPSGDRCCCFMLETKMLCNLSRYRYIITIIAI